tara:strand:+ start:1899 stop:2069 length:171 start_codon:yes stop_codon:yes gene_type:complete
MVNWFNKARISNIVAGSTIIFTLFAVVGTTIQTDQLLILASMSGFAGKHLWDSSQS